MEWQIFVISQMFFIMLGVGAGFWFRIRSVKSENAQLREHLEIVEAETASPSQTSPEEWAQAQVSELDAESPVAPVIQAVLENAVEPNTEFATQLQEIIAESLGTVDRGDSVAWDEEKAALESEVESLSAEITRLQSDSAEASGGCDLKQLLQNLTKDSRDMMACIQTLESENADLRIKLGLPDDTRTVAELTEVSESADTADTPTTTAETDEITTETKADATGPEHDAASKLDAATETEAESTHIEPESVEPAIDSSKAETNNEEVVAGEEISAAVDSLLDEIEQETGVGEETSAQDASSKELDSLEAGADEESPNQAPREDNLEAADSEDGSGSASDTPDPSTKSSAENVA